MEYLRPPLGEGWDRGSALKCYSVKIGDDFLPCLEGIATIGDDRSHEIVARLGGDEEIAHGTETAAESYTFVRYLVAANASYNNAVMNTIHQLAEKISVRAITEIQQMGNQ